MTPIAATNCDGVINKSGCFELKLSDLLTGFWPSTDGHLPSDEPACGFRNERCDYTLMIVVGILALIALFGAGAGFIFFRILFAGIELAKLSKILERIEPCREHRGASSEMICVSLAWKR